MEKHYEIVDRFLEAGEGNSLLYEPVAGEMRYRETRRYRFVVEGGDDALDAFARATLLDEVSQDLHLGEAPALEGFRFYLDYGMKPGALDLEKEAIVACHAGLENPGFEITSLEIRRRLYLFGEAVVEPARFVRDICNPAIHTWTLGDARNCA